MTTDAELAIAAREGDRRAFELLYRRHARRVAGLVYRLLGQDDAVDEIVQDVFVAAFEGLGDLRQPDKVGGWIRGIAVHHVRQTIARRTRWRAVVQGILEPPPEEPSTGDAERALASLSPRLRMPFVLHHLEGFTIPETAALCRVSEATTKRRCAEAAKRLARRLA
ncbi:MAG: RNA polymerase sigma factor [Sandaracinaceae bacterium]